MGYDEEEELEATGEWIMRVNEAGFSEELEYVPSQLAKLGVAPKDVVDRLDWLREHGSIETATNVATRRQVKPVSVLEKPEAQMDGLDYDSFGPWEWFSAFDNMIEDSMKSTRETEPGLADFNMLIANETRLSKRGRVARMSMKANTELASVNSENIA